VNTQLRSRYQSIDVGTDLTPRSDAAVKAALDWAALVGARRVHLVTAIHHPSASFEVLERDLADAKAQLALKIAPSTMQGELTWQADIADPHELLNAALKSSRADLLVLASHERGRAGRALMGSVTDQHIRDAQVPVLVVAPDRPLQLPVSSVLLAVDPLGVGPSLIDHAAAWASDRLEVLSCHWGDERQHERLKTELNQLVAKRVHRPLELEVFVRRGQPAEVISGFAHDRKHGLVVVGTNTSELHVADDVAAQGPCPVLVVPSFVTA